jgi:sec-independent protein translocase protein TatA
MFKPGPLEIGLIVFIVLVLFGAGKLPQVGAAMGTGIRAFRRGQGGGNCPTSSQEDDQVKEGSQQEKLNHRFSLNLYTYKTLR